ncbi:threonine transporter RhtB [Vibrio harveyi]|uniref:threonine transporter RhtB n=1 Tax=Vibrio harveyi TaxID=669 RepID=UPI002ED528DC|nr:threonine transporter RhtB [Vibrio harveyi]
MHSLVRILIILIAFIAALAGIVAWKTIPQLHFVEKGMQWNWHWSYFEPFSNGIQTTRTQDTKQLLLRRVYLQDSTVVFVGTTLDNKFEIDVVNQASCEPKSSKWVSVSVNGQPMSHVPMVCEKTGETYIYRFIGNKLRTLEFGIDDSFIREDFTLWPISEIKADQFKQQHSTFFNKKDGGEDHQWLRD